MEIEEYVRRFNNADNKGKLLARFIIDFLKEVAEAFHKRGVKTDEGLFAALDEQDGKWRQFAAQVKGVNPDGFLCIMQNRMSDIHSKWMRHRKQL